MGDRGIDFLAVGPQLGVVVNHRSHLRHGERLERRGALTRYMLAAEPHPEVTPTARRRGDRERQWQAVIARQPVDHAEVPPGRQRGVPSHPVLDAAVDWKKPRQPRGTRQDHPCGPQPGPTPRFSRTKPVVNRPPPKAGQHTDEVLADWGVSR